MNAIGASFSMSHPTPRSLKGAKRTPEASSSSPSLQQSSGVGDMAKEATTAQSVVVAPPPLSKEFLEFLKTCNLTLPAIPTPASSPIGESHETTAPPISTPEAPLPVQRSGVSISMTSVLPGAIEQPGEMLQSRRKISPPAKSIGMSTSTKRIRQLKRLPKPSDTALPSPRSLEKSKNLSTLPASASALSSTLSSSCQPPPGITSQAPQTFTPSPVINGTAPNKHSEMNPFIRVRNSIAFARNLVKSHRFVGILKALQTLQVDILALRDPRLANRHHNQMMRSEVEACIAGMLHAVDLMASLDLRGDRATRAFLAGTNGLWNDLVWLKLNL